MTIVGAITESNTPGLVGESVQIAGKVMGTSVQGLTVTSRSSVFHRALLVVIVIIAILIAQ
ncbi:MAG TPA: hypothetical protein VMH81_02585 [Bryobacteraceae bacterium]|nr:hypothetical protein [Bryobacteraceae bacterium]